LIDRKSILNSLGVVGGANIKDIESSRCGTIRTLSTCEESKKTRQPEMALNLKHQTSEDLAAQAMSN